MCETTKYLIFVSSIPETKAKESVTKEHLKKIMAGNLLNLAKYIILQIRK